MQQYGLVGYPLKHSFSQRFFTDKFRQEQIDAVYRNFEIADIALLPGIIRENPDLSGLNVTIPYKEVVMPYLDNISPDAAAIGAINVIKIEWTDGKPYLTGYNSDVIGFQYSISPLLNPQIHHKALILGTGGASKAVRQGLLNLGIEATYVSRKRKDNVLAYEDLSGQVMREHTVIVNCTPLGTFPDVDTAPDIPYNLLTTNHLLYDLVYNPAETKFLRLGKEQGATVKNGYEMLELQALAAWDIWNS
ncbi:shikimate dehydrogenase [Dysgonomonas sp. 25]|uniref:shikimate dehydrogenase family protein n=1 Tax=Dysgonomonas sp. 25 TaxID=2302933 RepID=UPI0013D12520|nr:shikimate dehydrogenase [Dysgonomonas sp. 25]NDV68913.1 shikimate dehydrogenase [Dysgonomonas sp. 25]